MGQAGRKFFYNFICFVFSNLQLFVKLFLKFKKYHFIINLTLFNIYHIMLFCAHLNQSIPQGPVLILAFISTTSLDFE